MFEREELTAELKKIGDERSTVLNVFWENETRQDGQALQKYEKTLADLREREEKIIERLRGLSGKGTETQKPD